MRGNTYTLYSSNLVASNGQNAPQSIRYGSASFSTGASPVLPVSRTRTVYTVSELTQAAATSYVTTIVLGASLTSDLTLNHLVNIDLGGHTLTGNVSITNATESGTYSISNGTITGTLAVNTPNAQYDNSATVTGKTTIVEAGTFVNESGGHLGPVDITDPNPMTFTNDGLASDVGTVTVDPASGGNVTFNGALGHVKVSGGSPTVDVASGTVTNLEVDTNSTTVKVESGATVSTINVDSSVTTTAPALQNGGTVTLLDNQSPLAVAISGTHPLQTVSATASTVTASSNLVVAGDNNVTVSVTPKGPGGAPIGSGQTVTVSDGNGTTKTATWNKTSNDYEATFSEHTAQSDTFRATVNSTTPVTQTASVQVTPAVGTPTIGTATEVSGGIRVAWQASSGTAPSSYVVLESAGGGYSQVATAAGGATSTTVTGLTAGTTYEFKVEAVDAYHNDSTQSGASNSVTYGTAAPTVSNSGYINASTDTTYTVSGTGTTAGDTINFTLTDSNGKTVTGSTTVQTGLSWTATGVDASSLSDGPVNITATETDVLGNPSLASTAVNVTKDTVAPTISSITLANASGGTAGTIENGDTIAITFSEPIDPTSIAPGLTDGSSVTVGAPGSTGQPSVADEPIGGAVVTVNNIAYFSVGASASRQFYTNDTAALSSDGKTLTITLGGGSAAAITSPSDGAITTSSNYVTDLAGNLLTAGSPILTGSL